MLLTLILAVAAAAPSPQAEQLGRQLAERGLLASLIPLLAEKETGELIAAHPDYSAAEKVRLHQAAATVAQTDLAKIVAAQGHAYATALPLADLRALVAFARTPAAAKQRAIQPHIIAATMAGLQGVDFKREVTDAFCADGGTGCPPR